MIVPRKIRHNQISYLIFLPYDIKKIVLVIKCILFRINAKVNKQVSNMHFLVCVIGPQQ